MIKKNIKITLHEFSMLVLGFLAAFCLTFSNLLVPFVSFANGFDDDLWNPDASPKAGQIRPKSEFSSTALVFQPPKLTFAERSSLVGKSVRQCVGSGILTSPLLPPQAAATVGLIFGVSKLAIDDASLREDKDKTIRDAQISFNKGEASRSDTEDTLKKAGADPNLIKQSLNYGTCLNANPEFQNQMNKRNSQGLFTPPPIGSENTACYLGKKK